MAKNKEQEEVEKDVTTKAEAKAEEVTDASKEESTETVAEEEGTEEKGEESTEDGSAETSKEEEEEDTEKTVHEENAELNDKYLRLYSDFDNFRRRTAKERLELMGSAAADVFSALLPVLDDFDRANKAIESNPDDNSTLKEGFDLIHEKMRRIMIEKGLEEMDSMGKEFNADKYEAVTNIPAPSKKEKGKVLDVLEKGYSMNGKIIRFAKVVVGA